MTKEYRAKTFKSGNSVALRLPKGLGIAEGDELVLIPHESGSFTIMRKGGEKELLQSLYGSMSPGFMADGRGDIEQEERDWSRTPAHRAA